jgi:argininosuccinate lyase
MEPVIENMRAAAGKGYSTATDLADWLVRVADIPFRDAHGITGAVVKKAEDKGVDLVDLSLDEMQEIDPRITEDVFGVLSVEASVASRTSFGGTAPDNVRNAVADARTRFSGE